MQLPPVPELFRPLLTTLLVVAGVCAALGALLLALTLRKLRRVRVPPGAGLLTTLRAVPLALVIALDLLDLGLDFLAAPFVWAILSRFNLQALRNVAAVEALIPFTQPIPTLTLAWFVARAIRS